MARALAGLWASRCWFFFFVWPLGRLGVINEYAVCRCYDAPWVPSGLLAFVCDESDARVRVSGGVARCGVGSSQVKDKSMAFRKDESFHDRGQRAVRQANIARSDR